MRKLVLLKNFSFLFFPANYNSIRGHIGEISPLKIYSQKSALSSSKNDFASLSVSDYTKRRRDLRILDQSQDRSQHDLSNRISCRYKGTQTTTISMIFTVFR